MRPEDAKLQTHGLASGLNLVLASTTVLFWYRIALFDT
jgi:hypothetical protein